jgi:hypothetical protein
VYVDDVIMSHDAETHRDTCERVRTRLLELGIKLNSKKVQHDQLEVRLLGHMVSHDCIRPCPDYTDGLLNRVLPRTPTQRSSFRGAVGWIAKFIPDCAKLLEKFNDSPDQSTFDTILHAIQRHVTLSPMIPGQPLELHADASLEGWGGVLTQQGRVLGCAGGKWSISERNWMVREQELQGVLRSLRHFAYYATGATVHVHTDHSSNCNVKLHRKVNQSKLLNWLAELASWQLLWHHVPGKNNEFADWLSRNPSDIETLRWFEHARDGENVTIADRVCATATGTDGNANNVLEPAAVEPGLDTSLEGGS